MKICVVFWCFLAHMDQKKIQKIFHQQHPQLPSTGAINWLLVLWSQNSIFLVLGLNPRTRNCYLWDQMLSSNPIFGLCRELMSLQLMLLPNLTQNKKVFYHQIPEEGIRGSGINPRVHKMLFWVRSQYSEGSYCGLWDHFQNPFFRRWDQFQILIGTSHFTWVWFGIHLFCLLWDWKVWSIYLLVCCPSWSVLMNIEEDSAKLFALNPPVRHFSAQTDVTDKHSLMTLEFMKVFNSDALITYRNYTWVAKIRRVSMEKRVCKDLK